MIHNTISISLNSNWNLRSGNENMLLKKRSEEAWLRLKESAPPFSLHRMPTIWCGEGWTPSANRMYSNNQICELDPSFLKSTPRSSLSLHSFLLQRNATNVGYCSLQGTESRAPLSVSSCHEHPPRRFLFQNEPSLSQIFPHCRGDAQSEYRALQGEEKRSPWDYVVGF